MSIVTPTETIESDQVDTEIGNHIEIGDQNTITVDDINNMSSSELKKTLNKKKRKGDDNSCTAIKEKDYKKNGIKFIPKKSNQSDDIVVRTTADMSPYCKRLVDDAALSLDTSFESAFVKISSSTSESVFSNLLPIYDEVRQYLIPAFRLSIEDEDSDLGFSHTQIYKKYDDKIPIKVTLMLHSSVFTRIKAHSLVFSINNSDIFEYLVYTYYLSLEDDIINEKVKEVCKRRADYFIQHITEKLDSQKGFSKEEISDLKRLSSKMKFLGIEKASVYNDFMNVYFNGKTTDKSDKSKGIYQKKLGKRQRKQEKEE